MRGILFGTAALAWAISIVATPSPAQAWWRGGFGFYGPGIILGPPVVYAPPPPVYDLPPRVYYAPPRVYYTPVPVGQTCFAGPYICPLDRPTARGATCTCPANNGRAYGSAH